MPSKIEYQTWSGGSGMGDPKKLIGYCREEPQEVLEGVYKSHYIYHYKDLYRPVDYSYPNNCLGLMIKQISNDDLEKLGIAQAVSYEKLDLNIALGNDLNRTKETFQTGLESATRWHITNECDLITKTDEIRQSIRERNEKYLKQLDEVRSVTLK